MRKAWEVGRGEMRIKEKEEGKKGKERNKEVRQREREGRQTGGKQSG